LKIWAAANETGLVPAILLVRMINAGRRDKVDTGAYRVADLEQNEELLQDISRLEAKMRRELGRDIALIAYSKGEPEDAGRA
jgi:hypothetical protein